MRQAGVVCTEPNWQPHRASMLGYASAEGCRRGVIGRWGGPCVLWGCCLVGRVCGAGWLAGWLG